MSYVLKIPDECFIVIPPFSTDQHNLVLPDQFIFNIAALTNGVRITGITFPFNEDDDYLRSIYLVNHGAKNIILRSEDVNSLPTHRIAASGHITLSPNATAFMIYDKIDSRWRIVASS